MHPVYTRATVVARNAFLAGALFALLAGCNRPQPGATTTAQPSDAPTAPSSSPTPPASRIVLVSPTDAADPAFAAETLAAVQQLAAGAPMEFAASASLPEDASGIALLVVIPPDPGVQEWAVSHPDSPVISLGIAGVQPASNFTVIAPDGVRYDQLGFALGYLAAMVTPEYRVAALALDQTPANLALSRGFVAGGTYYCGLCSPVHPPYFEYPLLLQAHPADLPVDSVSTLLVVPPARSLADLGFPGNARLALVGVGEPPAELAASWIASAGFDVAAALEIAWTQVQDGQPGSSLPLGIQFHSVDSGVVSEGRLALAEALLGDLAAGVIDTGVDPLSGEPR